MVNFESATVGRLAGKTALISGGARGQGAEEARLFVAHGASVIIADLIQDEGHALALELGSSATYKALDVTKEDSWDECIDIAERMFGKLDILVNNAGVFDRTPIEDSDLEKVHRIYAVNQFGVFLGMRAAVRLMKNSG